MATRYAAVADEHFTNTPLGPWASPYQLITCAVYANYVVQSLITIQYCI